MALLAAAMPMCATAAETADSLAANPHARKPVRPQHRATAPVAAWPDTLLTPAADGAPLYVEGEAVELRGDSLTAAAPPLVAPVVDSWDEPEVEMTFNPSPTRAVWLSALCPGLGQLYNRRYWKLPIIIGGYMGLGYATSWNNSMLRDYSRAYFDLMDNDPSTRSYMDFFPVTTKEEDLNRTWLENTFKNRKNYYRRNRDLCIICMVGVYLIAMVDAYVDAQLAHFDISPDLTLDMVPTLIPDERSRPGLGMCWALTF